MESTAELLDDQAIIEEALANFTALIDDFDFGAELDLLNVGRLQFMRRRQMQTELKALYMAIWRLALSRSFPQYADEMFTIFLRRYGASHPGKIGAQIVERAMQYWGMLAPAGDGDFNDVARHIVSFMEREPTDPRALILKLALHIRGAYRFIFERLI